jgi:hypothetical protein
MPGVSSTPGKPTGLTAHLDENGNFNVMPGQTMQFAVQGVNDSLQGVLSDPIQFTMPPLAKTKPAEAKAPAAATEAAVGVQTNGHGHGHTNGHRTSRRR